MRMCQRVHWVLYIPCVHFGDRMKGVSWFDARFGFCPVSRESILGCQKLARILLRLGSYDVAAANQGSVT
jgi:hypothetical protein